MNAIEIKNLHFSYGKENVLDGVSLCLKEGRLAILAGENGVVARNNFHRQEYFPLWPAIQQACAGRRGGR